jgi:hypothetical protein
VDDSKLRTRDAISQTTHVLAATLVESGSLSPGPPGAQHVDGARFRVDQTLSPGSSAPLSGTLTVSYTRQVLPERSADPELRRGSKYVLFGTLTGRRLHALKIVPYSEDTVRIVASAFAAGARHEPRT